MPVPHQRRALALGSTLLAIGAAACARGAARPSAAPASPAAAATSAAEPRELAADQQVIHALNRLAFGPRPGDVQRVRAMGVDRWIDEQLHPERIPDAATDEFLARFPTLRLSGAELVREYPPAQLLLARRALRRDTTRRLTPEDSAELRRAAQRGNQPAAELVTSRVARAVMSERQLQEVMVDFWENHFNIYAAKGPVTRHYLVEFDREVIRRNALGNFRELLGGVAKSPAMLFYLDNWQSTADSGRPVLQGRGMGEGGRAARRAGRRVNSRPPSPTPLPAAPAGRRRGLNENYARELMELHTLGVDGGYTQQDVIDVARALTGWTILAPRGAAARDMRRGMGDAEPGEFLFRPEVHDAGEKTVLGHRLKAGRGIEDGEQVLDIVARHPSTARFIAFKLARRLVSDTPPAALVERAAAVFRRTDGDIRETVRTIVTSPEFFSAAAYRAKVKTPFEVVVSALRAMNAAPDPTPRTAQIVARLGQPLYGHQAPNGWPETGDAWINTGAILNRINFGAAVAAGRVPGVSAARWAPAERLRGAPRDSQVDGVIAAILNGDASPDTRAILLSGENPFLGSNAARADSLDAGADDAVGADDAGAMAPPPDEMGPRREQRRAARTGGGRRAMVDGRRGALGQIPELAGLAQIVGLALGAPEFQRK